MKRRDRWDAGRLTSPSWKFVIDISIGAGRGLYVWAAIGRRYLWVQLIRGKRDSIR